MPDINISSIGSRGLGKYHVCAVRTRQDYEEAEDLRRKAFHFAGTCDADEFSKPYDEFYKNPSYHTISVFRNINGERGELVGTGQYVIRDKELLPIEEMIFMHNGKIVNLNQMAEKGLFGNLDEKVVRADSQFRHLGISPEILSRGKAGVIGICNNIIANVLYLVLRNDVGNSIIVADPRFARIYNGVYQAFTIWPEQGFDKTKTGRVLLYPDKGGEGWKPAEIMYCTRESLESRFGPLVSEIERSDEQEDFNEILRRAFPS